MGDAGLGSFLALFGVHEALNVGLSLANRKRKFDDALGCLLDLLGVLEGQQGAGVAEAELAGLDAGLH